MYGYLTFSETQRIKDIFNEYDINDKDREEIAETMRIVINRVAEDRARCRASKVRDTILSNVVDTILNCT